MCLPTVTIPELGVALSTIPSMEQAGSKDPSGNYDCECLTLFTRRILKTAKSVGMRVVTVTTARLRESSGKLEPAPEPIAKPEPVPVSLEESSGEPPAKPSAKRRRRSVVMVGFYFAF